MLLIMNPGSRAGRGKRLWGRWETGLREAGVRFDTAHTGAPGDAFELARAASSYGVVVAVGGDGTINEVLDGVAQSGKRGLRMGVLYSGTSPDFCRFHGIPTEPEKALEILVAGKARTVDVARIAHHDENGVERVAHFGSSCNIGMGAAVARYSNRWRRFTGDTVGTAASVVRALAVNARVDLDLNIDGQTHRLEQTNNLTIAKNPYLASGLKLALDVQPDDGRLWLVGVHGKGRLGMCGLVPKFYSGTVTHAPSIFLQPCSSVTVRSSQRQEIEFDGDPRGFLPARIEIVPEGLNLICPGGLHAVNTRKRIEREDGERGRRRTENEPSFPRTGTLAGRDRPRARSVPSFPNSQPSTFPSGGNNDERI